MYINSVTMPSESQRRQALSCAENISLLSIINPTPSVPGENTRRPPKSKNSSLRILSFDCEISLTSTLAFLCGISDDPDHVVAVCVEELVQGKGLRVLVAVNKKNPESGTGVLQRIEDGLGKVLRCLSRETNGA